MINTHIEENIKSDFWKTDKKTNLVDVRINGRIFTAKNSSAGYRQINLLSGDGLLSDVRSGKKGWRKFSLKELVYIAIVMEVKSFGLQHSQLRELFNLFSNSDYSNDVDLIMWCVFERIEIVIEISSDGSIDIYDLNFYAMLHKNLTCIKLCFNNSVNEVLRKIGLETYSIKQGVEKAGRNEILQPKEKKLIEIIRNGNYSSIKAKKQKDNEVFIVYAEQTKTEKDKLTDKDILKILEDKDFQDINIVKRDGKIVSQIVNETIKL